VAIGEPWSTRESDGRVGPRLSPDRTRVKVLSANPDRRLDWQGRPCVDLGLAKMRLFIIGSRRAIRSRLQTIGLPFIAAAVMV